MVSSQCLTGKHPSCFVTACTCHCHDAFKKKQEDTVNRQHEVNFQLSNYKIVEIKLEVWASTSKSEVEVDDWKESTMPRIRLELMNLIQRLQTKGIIIKLIV